MQADKDKFRDLWLAANKDVSLITAQRDEARLQAKELHKRVARAREDAFMQKYKATPEEFARQQEAARLAKVARDAAEAARLANDVANHTGTQALQDAGANENETAKTTHVANAGHAADGAGAAYTLDDATLEKMLGF